MQIELVEGVPYQYLSELQALHAHVFDGSPLPLEKLENKEGLLCLFAMKDGAMVGFKLGYMHPDHVFYSWLGGVHESQRGRGIANGLMVRQHEEVKKLGFQKIRTYGRNQRKAMLITNIKHGFEIISTFVDAKGRHKIIFEKSLVK
ncbi:GNAT family N-acetyltransferase [Metasolibacillus meyeri]|uniref:GNAT family N-acetyltransferase n=1 Tax=Metasolibacillus meyeri TaxID=1071052 RepID=A0AAW9NPQ9_9BACL|nr:GNAT family N-acetyltransferase [Metasolibacillus meyeri]MEC1177838.1 GNAT family N-acetyltransferase [Metasolibacillus meyeri]